MKITNKAELEKVDLKMLKGHILVVKSHISEDYHIHMALGESNEIKLKHSFSFKKEELENLDFKKEISKHYGDKIVKQVMEALAPTNLQDYTINNLIKYAIELSNSTMINTYRHTMEIRDCEVHSFENIESMYYDKLDGLG